MVSGIYGAMHRETGRWYVGRAVHVVSRWAQHKRLASRGSAIPFHAAIRELGEGSFIWMVLQPCSAVEAVALEKEWIAKLAAYPGGFNSTAGGELTPGDYEAVRQKMAAAWKKRTDRSFLGRKHSPETIAKIKEAAKRRGPEWRQKLSAIAKSRRYTPEQRAALIPSRKRIAASRKRDAEGRFL